MFEKVKKKEKIFNNKNSKQTKINRYKQVCTKRKQTKRIKRMKN